MSNMRFTAYISKEEDQALRHLAATHGTSVNFIVRCAIRMMLGLSVPDAVRQAMEEAHVAKTR